MYFTCTVLKSLMKVSSCDAARNNVKKKRQPCMSCKVWQGLTTDPTNLKTVAEVEAAWEIKEEPVRFDAQADINRVHSIGKGRRYHGRSGHGK